ncbi:MAG: J domain-containing protein, partial [Lachnospiraceae bacterium]|nr:J domain-containing protein [Lachnospiraceae bacterium]
MNQIWEVLGIAPTSDKRAIRSAYSVLVKQCHPEEDPQGFQKLHGAYQAAMEYAAKNEEQTGNIVNSVCLAQNREEAGEKDPLTPSLLSRLAQVEEDELSKSMHSGALRQFSAILNDPKKFRKADEWKAFFLSEDFLKEQYQESFANGMLQILQDFYTKDHFNIVQMPSGFLMELAIAYALVLNSGQSEERAASFYAREVAASIWNMQKGEYMPVRLLLKPENQVRMYSFADYIRLKNYNSRGLLTRQNQEEWKGLIRGGMVNHLYELKGRGEHGIYPETRSVCLIELYIFWIKMDTVPKCILEYMYQEYNLRSVEHTSTRKYYEPLKQAILAQYPNIEEALYGEEGRAELVSTWYRAMMKIISDSGRYYEETEEIRGRVKALFESGEWLKIRYLPELFQKMELQLYGRSVIPASLAKQLMEYYSDGMGVIEQAWEKEQGEVMTEEMIHSLYYGRMIMDMHGSVPRVTPYFQDGKFWEVYKGGVENEGMVSGKECKIICTDFFSGYPHVLSNQDFWHYFLMRGFGCRSARIIGRGKQRRKYIVGGKAFLSTYIEYLYQP